MSANWQFGLPEWGQHLKTTWAFGLPDWDTPQYSESPSISKWRNKESRRTMNIKLGDTHTIRWATTDPATGAASDASAQTVSVYEEATDTAIVTPTATKASTGSYRADIVATSGNGFEAGKAYNVEVAATVGGVATKMFVLTFKVDAAGIDDLSKPGTAQTISSNADITAIKAKTDNLPASPAAVGSQMDLVNAPNATAITAIQSGLSKPGTAQAISSNADITAIKAKTDNLPASPAAVSDIPGAETNAAAVRTNLSTELGRIDAAISTRSAPGTAQTITAPADMALNSTVAKDATVMKSASYTAPDNAGIAAIKAKTDNLPASPAASSDIPSASTNAGAVRTELATELSRVDASISSRLASGAYTAPDNTGIGQINARLPSDPAVQSLLEAALAALPSAIGSRLVAGFTWDEILHLSGALAASKLTGMTTGSGGTTKLRKLDDSGDLVVATQDANGNRTAVTVTP